jgi:hypothetical protein
MARKYCSGCGCSFEGLEKCPECGYSLDNLRTRILGGIFIAIVGVVVLGAMVITQRPELWQAVVGSPQPPENGTPANPASQR